MDPAYYDFYTIPFGLSQVFDREPNLRDYYFSLPDEAQQAVLREDIHSDREFYDCVKRLKMKE